MTSSPSPLRVTLLAALLIAAGCATHDPIKMETPGHVRPSATAHLEIGMPKARVIQLLGTPISVNATGGTVTLVYLEERPWWNWVKIGVHCTNGVVASFGELRSIPTSKQIIEYQ